MTRVPLVQWVSDLILHELMRRNTDVVGSLFLPEKAQIIKGILLSIFAEEDRLV